jgi:hypothetical protein
MVKVHCGQGVATQISPKPCTVGRETGREASVGKMCRPAIEPRKAGKSGVPTLLRKRKATPTGALSQVPEDSAWSKNLACTEASCREPGGLTAGQETAMVRIGKAMSCSR